MNFTQQFLSDLFKKAANFQPVKIGKVNQGSTIAVNIGYGSVRAQALQNLSKGDAIAFQTDQGNWYLIGSEQTAQNTTHTQQVPYRVVKPPKVIEKYSVITLIGVEGLGDSELLPGTGNHTEFWLTGGQFKKINSMGYNTTEYILDAENNTPFSLVTNLGNNKYLTVANKYQTLDTNYNGDTYKLYNKSVITIDSQEIITNRYSTNGYGYGNRNNRFFYLGDGIWQSVIDNGISQLCTLIDSKKEESIYNPNVLINNYFGTDMFLVPHVLACNVLPDNSNDVIYNKLLVNLPGLINMDFTDIFDNPGYDDQGSGLIVGYRAGRYFGLLIGNISHEVYLPSGNTTFSYAAIKELTDNGQIVEGNILQDCIYTETMSGELLVMAWKNNYITNTFDITTQLESTYTDAGYPGSYNITSSTLHNSQTIKLNNNIILNNTSKFLQLPFKPLDITSELPITLTLESASFKISYLIYGNYSHNQLLDLSVYENEPIITSCIIGLNSYIVRGKIQTVAISLGTYTFTINELVFSKIPGNNIPEMRPFYNVIVLDNGCFWNYYFSFVPKNNNSIEPIGYMQYILDDIKEGTGQNERRYYIRSHLYYYNNYVLICDQTIPFVNTNPISRGFCKPYPHSNYLPPSLLLMVDNLVKNTIYRCEDPLLLTDTADKSNSEVSFKKMPVSEWKITPDGDIKYTKTKLVDYKYKRPFYNGTNCNANAIYPLSHSYYP